MISRLDHYNIVTADMGRAVAFYTGLLGFREAGRAVLEGEWIGAIVGLSGVRAEVVFLAPPDEGGPRLELLRYLSPEGEAISAASLPNTVGLRHLAFRVDDIDAAVARLRDAGVKAGDPVTVPPGIVPGATGTKRLCYFHDPDGVLLELAEYRP